jgi:hypothetical protein
MAADVRLNPSAIRKSDARVAGRGLYPAPARFPVQYADATALVAQRIEHLTTDQKVGGSSPSERATYQQVRAISSVVRGGPPAFLVIGQVVDGVATLGDGP